jgi:hypothetical protein
VYAVPWTSRERWSKRTPLHLIDAETPDDSGEAVCVRCGRRIALRGPDEGLPLPPYSYATDPDDWQLFGSLSHYQRCTSS